MSGNGGNGIDVLRERLGNMITRFEAHVDTEEANQERITEALDKNNVCHLEMKDELAENKAGVDKLYALSKWAWIIAGVAAPMISGLLVYIFKTHAHGKVLP